MSSLLKVLLPMLMLLGWSACNAGVGGVWMDPAVLKSIRDPQVLTMERSKLVMDDNPSIGTCEAYLAAKPTWDVEQQERAMSQYAVSEYLVCDAWAWRQEVETGVSVADPRLGSDLCNRLDLSTFQHSLEDVASKPGTTLRRLRLGKPKATGNQCKLHNRDSYFVMRAVMQRTDPTTHNKQLWVWITDDILEGTYRTRFAQWFEWSPGDGLWKAMAEEPKP